MESQSGYTYPGTDVLRNKANLLSQEELEQFELAHVYVRGIELHKKPIDGDFDLWHLQKVHYHLFQDVYPFAGKIRTENIAKSNFAYGNARFIEDAAQDLFRHLKRENCLVGLHRDEFVERIAYYLTEWYAVHPFREGNSRTLREFVRTLAMHVGYQMKWPPISREKWLHTMFQAIEGKSDLLRGLIDQSIQNREPDRKLMQIFRDPNQER